MREVNLVDYAPWLRRGLIGCIVQALVFIGLSGIPFFPALVDMLVVSV